MPSRPPGGAAGGMDGGPALGQFMGKFHHLIAQHGLGPVGTQPASAGLAPSLLTATERGEARAPFGRMNEQCSGRSAALTHWPAVVGLGTDPAVHLGDSGGGDHQAHAVQVGGPIRAPTMPSTTSERSKVDATSGATRRTRAPPRASPATLRRPTGPPPRPARRHRPG